MLKRSIEEIVEAVELNYSQVSGHKKVKTYSGRLSILHRV